MAYIGESRKSAKHPWEIMVCLDAKDCEMLMDAIGKSVGRRLRSYVYYKGVVEGGEVTTRQQDNFTEAEENYETILGVHSSVMEYLKLYSKKGRKP